MFGQLVLLRRPDDGIACTTDTASGATAVTPSLLEVVVEEFVLFLVLPLVMVVGSSADGDTNPSDLKLGSHIHHHP
jgi:hypothetical protein